MEITSGSASIAFGEVEGESFTAQRLKNELDGEGVFVTGLDDDPRKLPFTRARSFDLIGE